MRKIITFLLLAFLLSGCVSADGYDIDSVIEGVGTLPSIRSNTYSKYYNCYIPSDVSELGFDDISVVMDYNSNQMIMNLNVMNIVSPESDKLYDDGFFEKEHMTLSKDGQFEDGRHFELNVYDHNDRFIVHLKTSDVSFYGNCLESEVGMMADRMLLIGNNIIVKTDDVLRDFKSKDLIDYHRKQIDLFEMVIAPDGRLEDLVLNNSNTGEGQ